MRHLLLLAIQVILFSNGAAQLPLILRAQNFSHSQGLSNNLIYHMGQDESGFLWIGTANGLNRFDGKNFTVFKKDYSNPNSILNNIVMRVAVDHDNRIWLGYGADGISCYDQVSRKFTHFLPDSTQAKVFPYGPINDLFIDKENILWFTSGNNGLYRMDLKSYKTEFISNLPFVDKTKPEKWRKHFNIITQIIEGDSDTLWMATGDGFYSFDKKTRRFEVYRMSGPGINYERWKPDVFNSICRMSGNDFYLAGWGTGLNHYDVQKKQWTNYLIRPDQPESGTANIIGSLQKKSEHEIWVTSADTNLSIFNTLENKFYHISQEQINTTNLTEKGGNLFTDRSGDLWFGPPNGLHMILQSQSDFTFTPVPVTRSGNNMNYGVMDILEDSLSGTKLIATNYADGLNVISYNGKQKNLEYEGPPGTPDQFGGELFKDSRNNIWVLSRSFAHWYDTLNSRLVLPVQPVPDTSVGSYPFFARAVENRKGQVFFCTYRHGIYAYDLNTAKWQQWVHQPGNEQSILSNIVVALEIDQNDDLWIGYKSHGVSRYSIKNKKFEHFRSLPGNMTTLIDNRILCSATDKKGQVWVGTISGLSVIDPSASPVKINNYIHNQDFLGLIIYDILFDRKGIAWMVTADGVIAFDPESYELRTYTYHHGLPPYYEILSLGRGLNDDLFLFGRAGYYKFSDSLSTRREKPSRVNITSFKSGDRIVNYEQDLLNHGKIILNANEDLFTAEFVSLYFKNPSLVSYRYRLSGVDQTWKTTGSLGFASYNNLKGGDYILEVQANLGGVWSEITKIPVHIATSFYKTTWFNILMILFFTSAIYILYRYRVRTIEKAEAIKTQFNKQIAETEMKALRAQMNPHFIFNCLNSINRYIIKNDHKTASLYLTKFAKLIRLILDNSESHEIALSQELEALVLYIEIEALRFDHRFSYEIEVDEEIFPDSIQIPTMVIQPYVENAIWHGLLHKDSQGKLKIHLYLESSMLVCVVQDDGVGREKAMELKSKSATTRKSLGLKITSERIEMLNVKFGTNGGVTFEDLKDEQGNACGTKVIIKIPVEI